MVPVSHPVRIPIPIIIFRGSDIEDKDFVGTPLTKCGFDVRTFKTGDLPGTQEAKAFSSSSLVVINAHGGRAKGNYLWGTDKGPEEASSILRNIRGVFRREIEAAPTPRHTVF